MDSNEIFKFLTKEEEKELIMEIKANNSEKAKEELIKSVYPMIKKIALKYNSNNKYELDELINIGVISVLECIDKYDDTKSKFFTYAYYYIFKEISAFVKMDNLVKYSHNFKDDFNKYIKQKSELEILYGKLSLQEISKLLNISLKNVMEFEKYNNGLKYLNDLLPDGETECLEILEDHSKNVEDEVITKIMREEVFNYIKQSNLSEKQKYILIKGYGLNDNEVLPYDKISKNVGLEINSCRNSKAKAMTKLRQSGISHLKTYIKG